MPVSTRIKVGSSMVITVQGKDEKDLIEQASFFGELPCKCGRCDSGELAFKYRRTDDYDFYELVCKACEATYALGQKKEGGKLYPRGNKETGEWDEKYVGEGRGDRRNDRGRDDRRDDRRDSRRDSRTERGSYRRDDRADPEQGMEEDDIPF